ncbi:uncharacterized protein [Nicotiana tomentosiformis]|nr:uncharacterized protein LOC104095320 isoform X3 [Nicotiana tomentosiformis]
MEGRKTNFTTVKGIRVDFSPQKMNKLPLVADRKTQAFIDQPKPHLDAIEDALYYFGADWGFETSGDKVILKVRNLKHRFMDPSSCPIPKFYSSEELQATAQQLPPLPPIENQPPPPPPVPTPIISDHGSGNLSNLVDLATIFPGYTPLSIPNVGGSSMMEPNSQSEMVKSPRIGGGEFSENWIPVPVTQCGSSQPREENYFGGDDVGGTSRFIMRFNPGG